MNELLEYDREHIWHPYTSMIDPLKVYPVESCDGVYINLSSGERLIDGMSSWWSVIHGYNNERLNNAAKAQIDKFSHVMFGGLTHTPAVELTKKLLRIVPQPLEKVFYSDSGSVAVEVAIKMALQYQVARGKIYKKRIATIEGGYHGDTWHAMSVCDPVGGMHRLYGNRLPEQIFVPRPDVEFGKKWDNTSLEILEDIFSTSHTSMAAFILEPIVQGAGGMRFYHPNFLKGVRALCNKYDVLLIADEIATGFGRTGKMFACEWAGVSPDIMCIGKALTGGYMSFAATLTTPVVSNTISKTSPYNFMHGPTFMANPLAAAIACESLDMLAENSPLERIKEIEEVMKSQLEMLNDCSKVRSVRVLGAIGVVEMVDYVNMEAIQAQFVKEGVWVRPFGKLVYVMPPYIITDEELNHLMNAIVKVVQM